jgi:hypothetical protein
VTRRLSAGERLVETKRLLREHGVRCINTPTVGGPLGGARGVHLQPAHNGLEIQAFHPDTQSRRRLLKSAVQVLEGEGWRVSYWTRPSSWRPGRREPFIKASPSGLNPWER